MIQNNDIPRSLALKYQRWLLDMLVVATLIFLISVPAVLAETPPSPLRENDQTQPVVRAGTTPAESETAMSQALDAQSTDSVDYFMMKSTTLRKSSVKAPAGSEFPSATTQAEIVKPLPIELPDLKIPAIENPDEVAMLVSEQCSQSGTDGDGTISCERFYSNGHSATVLTQNANEGDEIKSQTVIEEFDSDHAVLFKKTLRHRVDYNYLKDQKSKEKEFFDIIYQPAAGKTTRELMVYEYFLDTGKARSLSWTQYEQIENEPKAGLVYHALLRFGTDGNPERGLAERWQEGQKAETFMNWNQHAHGFATLDQESWKQWEGWIRSASMQAYLP